MADETTSTWANLLREMKGPLVEALKWKTVLLAEVKRDNSPRRWNGKQVTIPVITAPQQGTHAITESGTLSVPVTHDDAQANITAKILSIAVSFTTQVMEQATSGDGGWAEVVPLKMRMAEEAYTRTINEMFCGDGTGLLAVSAGASGSPGLTVLLTVATFNRYQLYPGRLVDFRTITTAADPGNGLKRKITSVVTGAAPSITVDTNAVASDAGSGNVTFAGTTGVYIHNVNRNVAGVNTYDGLSGWGAATATTGTFQGISKTGVPAWAGIDASPSAASDPTIGIFDGAERQVRTFGGSLDGPKFYLSDPAVIDKYTQGLTVQARWAGDQIKLESGFSGVSYRNKAIIPDYDMPPGVVFGVDPSAARIYTLTEGPDWDDKTGAIFQRFSTRSLPVEAWLVWMLQLGFHSCNAQVKIGNLNRAA